MDNTIKCRVTSTELQVDAVGSLSCMGWPGLLAQAAEDMIGITNYRPKSLKSALAATRFFFFSISMNAVLGTEASELHKYSSTVLYVLCKNYSAAPL